MLEDVLIPFQYVEHKEIGIPLVHDRIVLTIVGKASRSLCILENLMGLRVAEKLLKKSQDTWFFNRRVIQNSRHLRANILLVF